MAEVRRTLILETGVNERIIRRSIALTLQFAESQESLAEASEQAAKGIGGYGKVTQIAVANVKNYAASAHAHVQALARIAAQNENVDSSEKGLNQTRRRSISTIKSETDALYSELEALRRVSTASNNVAKSATGSPRGGQSTFERVGNAEAGISSLAGLTSTFGNNAITEALRGLADIVGTFEQLPRLAQAVTGSQQALASATATVGTASTAAAPGLVGVVAALGPIAIIGIAVATALSLVTQALQKGKEAAQQRIEIDRQLAELTIQGGQDEIKATLEQAELERRILEERGEALGRQFQAIREQGALSDIGELSEVVKTYKELDAAISENEQLIKELTLALDANATAAQDAVKGQEELARLTVTKIQRETEARLKAEELGATGSRETAEARLEAIAREKAALEDQRDSLESLADRSEAGREALSALNERLTELSREQRLITQTALPLIDAREKEAAAIKRTQEAFERNAQFRAATRERGADIREARGTFISDIATLERELGEKRTQIARETLQKIGEVERELADQQARLIASVEAEEARAFERTETLISETIQNTVDNEARIIEEAARRREDLERDHRETLQRINRTYNREASNAAARLDAIALIAAQQNRNDQLEEEDSRYREGQRQLEQALDDQLKENRKANEQRITELRQSYQREQADRRAALNTRLQELQQAAIAEIELIRQRSSVELAEVEQAAQAQLRARQEQFAHELQMLGVHLTNLNELTAEGLSMIAEQWATLYTQIGNMGAAAGGGSGGSVGEKPPQQLASGVRNFRGGIALVGERGPELAYLARGTNVYSNRETRAMMGTIHFSPTINTVSSDAKGIMRELRRNLPDLMADALKKASGV